MKGMNLWSPTNIEMWRCLRKGPWKQGLQSSLTWKTKLSLAIHAEWGSRWKTRLTFFQLEKSTCRKFLHGVLSAYMAIFNKSWEEGCSSIEKHTVTSFRRRKQYPLVTWVLGPTLGVSTEQIQPFCQYPHDHGPTYCLSLYHGSHRQNCMVG